MGSVSDILLSKHFKGASMNGKNFQELIKNLQVFYKCPSCGSNYHFDDIKFLGKVDSHCFMQLNCHDCSLPVLATVLLSGTPSTSKKQSSKTKKTTSLSRKSDLKPKEKARFTAKGEISASEIAQFHLFLSSYTGDLSNLAK